LLKEGRQAVAGLPAAYVVQQMADFKSGVVEKLSMDDMISLAAYAASLSP